MGPKRESKVVGKRYFSPLDVMQHPETREPVPYVLTPTGPRILEDGDHVDLLIEAGGQWSSEPPQHDVWIHVEVRKIENGWFYVMPMQHQATPGSEGRVGEGWVDGVGRTID